MNAPLVPSAELPFLASPPLPIGRLGPFEVASDGSLSPSAPDEAPRFGFCWRERRIAARLVAGWKVEFSVIAGYVPFTAENPAGRPRVIAAVAALREALPEGWRVRLTPDHAVHLEAEAMLGRPPTVSRLLTEATRFVLALTPCIELLDEEGALTA
ncbi:MAG: hypothetical protein MUC89_05845 [Acetobacteraceae bacterium]|nr:hypothetical protein [Acetobacteraceae bacterium]